MTPRSSVFAFLFPAACLVLAPPVPAADVVADPPPIQMLVPGFTVRELPLQLNNLNNLVYAPDGRLFALGYDGNVFQLKDTDGDGFEDSATHFFNNEKNQILPSIGMTWGPGGLYIASRGCVLRIKDKGDGTGELETISSGWVEPTGKAGSSLDSIGIAVDPAGNVFFGLGCDNWREAYRVNTNSGKSDYNIYSERGTILKLSPDFKRREVVSTGLRFTVSLAFNRAGDLFCTEQEGATWLPNGNPFDELLHIQPGRHYGFPPRHPKYLPGVIDEPSVFDYAPQHQSTCGLHFNEPVANGTATFGPAWWRGDALVAGESRGKLWRTKLAKTAAGYVARTDLIACLSMLTVDAVPTPQGDMLVCCHSGKPDWGTGPTGKGKLYKISYTGKTEPQPVLAFAASPSETRVIFDRPLDPAQYKALAGQTRISMGRYVSAGDRFESFRPGYQVVKDQQTVPGSERRVLAAAVTADNRALVLYHEPQTEAVRYGLSLPDPTHRESPPKSDKFTRTQHPAVELGYDLTGAEAEWRDPAGKETWNAWLPHLDLSVARVFSTGSDRHQTFFGTLAKRGALKLRAQLDLSQMLHPAVQPGAKLEYEYPPEIVTVTLKSAAKMKVASTVKVQNVNEHEVRLTTEAGRKDWLPLEINLNTGSGESNLEISWITNEDPRPRTLPLRRILLPWATPKPAEATVERSILQLAGGDWQRGKTVFFSEKAACFKCHKVGNEGGTIGPDLSNLIHRDYASVMRDITQPSAAINPDHLAYNLELKDGDVINGIIMDDKGENYVMAQATGASLTIPKQKVIGMKASSISLMPEGLLLGLTPAQQRDLLTFILMEPPKNNKK
jgi:putative heme-binding domain-containing protein